MSGISITCFAASYAVAWLLEVTRLFFRSGLRGAFLLGFGGAGLVAHTLYLAHRAVNSGAAPLSSWYDWLLVAAWILTAMYLYLTLYRRQNPFGLFVLPVILLLIGAAVFAGSDKPFPKASAAQSWGIAHGVFLLLGTVAVLIGFVFGVMYLIQANRLKRKLLPPRGFHLPSLEWLEQMNERMIVVSVFMLVLGFLAGMVFNLVNRSVVPWTDPVVWSTSVLVLWMVAAALFSSFYKPARQGRKVAYLTVASLLFLLLSLGIVLLTDTRHTNPRATAATSPAAANACHPRSTLPVSVEYSRTWFESSSDDRALRGPA